MGLLVRILPYALILSAGYAVFQIGSLMGDDAVEQRVQDMAMLVPIIQQQAHLKSPATPRRQPALADGCYHVFIDAGSNRGVHGRFLFEPHLYPKSKFATKFDDIFGTNRTLQNVCVFAFEPNVEKHNETQRMTERMYQKMGWRYHYMPYGVSDSTGSITFYRNLDFFNGLKREEWGFGTHLHSTNESSTREVDVIDLSEWSDVQVFSRQVPIQNEFNKRDPVVAMKMDVEGSEYRTLNHMIETGVACKFDYIFGELHYEDVPQSFGQVDGEAAQVHNLTTVHHVERYAKYMNKALKGRGCPGFVEFDDEEYLHDKAPYPAEDNR